MAHTYTGRYLIAEATRRRPYETNCAMLRLTWSYKSRWL